MAKLTDEQRQEVKELLAANNSASKIVEFLERDYGVIITKRGVNQIAARNKVGIEKIRKDLNKLVKKFPITSQYMRLKEYQAAYDSDDIDQAGKLAILKEVAATLGERGMIDETTTRDVSIADIENMHFDILKALKHTDKELTITDLLLKDLYSDTRTKETELN